jgi:hypothetical protein
MPPVIDRDEGVGFKDNWTLLDVNKYPRVRVAKSPAMMTALCQGPIVLADFDAELGVNSVA